MWIHSGPSIPDLGAFFSPLVPKEMHNQFCNVLLITPFGIGWYLSLQKQVPKILLNPLSHFIFVYIMISSCNYACASSAKSSMEGKNQGPLYPHKCEWPIELRGF